MKKILLIAIVILSLTACATTNPKVSPTTEKATINTPTESEAKGILNLGLTIYSIFVWF